ncbi:hypothetical protein RR46_08907 [Papilio xuthus]|uniref:Uncharacterized protein n=1 Tax=Papilio xuthus TaxID=66420 RepID=A0A194PR63_PAPXU|nr:hypothetical protein RR46_08907 [Papilio xuthus]
MNRLLKSCLEVTLPSYVFKLTQIYRTITAHVNKVLDCKVKQRRARSETRAAPRGGEHPPSRDQRPSAGAPTLSAARPARVRGECTPSSERPSPAPRPTTALATPPNACAHAQCHSPRRCPHHHASNRLGAADLRHRSGLNDPPVADRYGGDAAHLSHKISPTSLLTSSLPYDCAKVAFF